MRTASRGECALPRRPRPLRPGFSRCSSPTEPRNTLSAADYSRNLLAFSLTGFKPYAIFTSGNIATRSRTASLVAGVFILWRKLAPPGLFACLFGIAPTPRTRRGPRRRDDRFASGYRAILARCKNRPKPFISNVYRNWGINPWRHPHTPGDKPFISNVYRNWGINPWRHPHTP